MSNRRTRNPIMLAIATPLAVLCTVAAVSGFGATGTSDPGRLQCIAGLDPDTVPVQTEPIVVTYAVPDSLGIITAVTPAEDSGIAVGRIDAGAQTVELRTATASNGDWGITLVGDESRTCVGTLTVRTIRH